MCAFQENLWGYGKRLEFVDTCCLSKFGRRSVSVLDIGCGNGSQLAIPLAERGYRVTGIDPDAPSIERAKRFPGASFICGLSSSLTGQFDLVVISEVLEHLYDPDSLLADSLRLIAPDGLLIVTVPNGYGPFELDTRAYHGMHFDKLFEGFYRLLRKLRRKSDPAPRISGSEDTAGHVQRFTLRRLGTMFGNHGLKVIERRATSFASGPFVSNTLARIPGFLNLNVELADKLPMYLSSGWMFALETKAHPREFNVTTPGAVIAKSVSTL